MVCMLIEIDWLSTVCTVLIYWMIVGLRLCFFGTSWLFLSWCRRFQITWLRGDLVWPYVCQYCTLLDWEFWRKGEEAKEKKREKGKIRKKSTDGWCMDEWGWANSENNTAHSIHTHTLSPSDPLDTTRTCIHTGRYHIYTILSNSFRHGTAQHRHPIYSRTCTFYFIHKSVKQESINIRIWWDNVWLIDWLIAVVSLYDSFDSTFLCLADCCLSLYRTRIRTCSSTNIYSILYSPPHTMRCDATTLKIKSKQS